MAAYLGHLDTVTVVSWGDGLGCFLSLSYCCCERQICQTNTSSSGAFVILRSLCLRDAPGHTSRHNESALHSSAQPFALTTPQRPEAVSVSKSKSTSCRSGRRCRHVCSRPAPPRVPWAAGSAADAATRPSAAGAPAAAEVCPICGAAYHHRRNLAEHMKRHTGQTTCCICHHEFAMTFTLRRHMVNRHGLTPEQVSQLTNKRGAPGAAPGPAADAEPRQAQDGGVL